MHRINLNGAWQVFRADETSAIPAAVPGCVHMDLLRAGLIEDPFYQDNESKQFWIGETDWTYERRFDVPAEFLQPAHIRLVCHGLDTLATLRLNGVVIGRTDNMYRVWSFDVKPHLKAGENTLSVRFDAPMPFLRAQEAEKGILPAWTGTHRVNSGGWLRKEPCNFGWDWGPKLVTSGIWRDIELLAFDARLSDLNIRQQHNEDRVQLDITAEIEGLAPGKDGVVRLDVTHNGVSVAHLEAPVVDGQVSLTPTINQPALWWVNGMGDQPLYTVQAQLVSESGDILDTQSRRIGLRTLTLERHEDEWGESFYFAVNGVPFFAKGANWIPADTFVPRLTGNDYDRLLKDAVAANMNMLRVWGGGVYEQDIFYDLCDEYGLALWQDFMFACGTYPAYDAAFMDNVRAEAEDNVRRLRHHPSLALWCGNNELEQGLVGEHWTESTMSWEDYGKLFDVLLPEVTNRLDPDRPYWPCSPHTPVGDRSFWISPESGDTHLWMVWHGREPFEWYRTCFHRFVSEFGFQSFPEPATINAVVEPESRNLTSYMMEYRQRSGIGNSTIIHYLLDWFRLPTSFDSSVWLSQVLQGMAIKYAVEHWRRNMPRTMGTLYWQINDCWPAPSWSSIDSLGRWKALHYMAKRFYEPVLISGVEDINAGTVDVHVTSDLGDSRNGLVRWALITTAGETLASGEMPISIPARQNTCVETLNLKAPIDAAGSRNVLVWLALDVDGVRVSDNLVLFARPKHLSLGKSGLRWDLQPEADGQYRVEISAEHPTLWVWLSTPEGDVKYSDNFFNLVPGQTHTIHLTPDRATTLEDLRARLSVQSLVDTYGG